MHMQLSKNKTKKQKYKHKILLIFFSTNKLSTQVEYWLVKTEQNGEKEKK